MIFRIAVQTAIVTLWAVAVVSNVVDKWRGKR